MLKSVRQVFGVVFPLCDAACPASEQVLVQARVGGVVIAFVLCKAKDVRLLRHVVDHRGVLAQANLVAWQPGRSEEVISVNVRRFRGADRVDVFPFRQVEGQDNAVVVFI